MMHTCCEDTFTDRKSTSHIRCAKRSSAALRTAMLFEERMEEFEVEELNSTGVDCEGLLSNATSESGLASRARRDAKSSLEQRALPLACGDEPALRLNAIGRAVRVFNDWFALCSYCGSMLKVTPLNRFGGEICCKRCDSEMLLGVCPESAEKDSKFCRYCGKQNVSQVAWKVLKAPLDASGRNAAVPPPLRSVQYCPSHFRNWLASAHRVLETKIILSHLALNARPIFSSLLHKKVVNDASLGLNDENEGDDVSTLKQAPKQKRRRRTKAEMRAARGEVGEGGEGGEGE